jgi:hypothetical protein
MIVAIQGSKNFDDYAIFLRGIGVALRTLNGKQDDKEFVVYSAGPFRINDYIIEFLNVNERSLKAYGVKAKLVKVPPKWLVDNVSKIDYLLYFGKPKESLPEIVDAAEAKDIEVGIYRY